MTKAALRKQVHTFVDQADEKTLRLVSALLNEALQMKDEGESMMTNAQYAEVQRRAEKFEAGESKMYSWPEVKAEIRKKYKAKAK